MEGIEIITTGDGSHSLLNTTLNETYHSHHGALQESVHVFIRNGLEHFIATTQRKIVNVFEVGFGTGLNAWLTMMWSRDHHVPVHYTTIESFPLPAEVWQNLNYADERGRAEFENIHTANWNEPVGLPDYFTLHKVHDTIQYLDIKESVYDVIYFDAFAPNKQPEMWELQVLSKVTRSLVTGGVLVTYCAKGQVKRDLRSLGLNVETLAGPPGKKEMVRGSRL